MATPLALFCDYDGTFAVQDVGATIAQRYAGARRAALTARFQSGGLKAWDYCVELFDGLQLAEEELHSFLRTVQIMPGARELIEWCKKRAVPFRVLSDGFNYNLQQLMQLHQVQFEFTANQLHIAGGRWRIAPGAPDATCGCGCGVCKAGILRAFRARAPGARVVHIGNGRVSDLCAARSADWVFAKDTLAQALQEEGRAFTPFRNLHDVRRALETHAA